MKSQLIPIAQRMGLARAEAAEYIGVSVSKFDEMVTDGRMPNPKKIDARRVWRRPALEAAFAELPEDGQSAPADQWSDAAA